MEYAWSITSKRQRKEYDLEKKSAQQIAAQRTLQAAEQPLPPGIESYLTDLFNPSVYTRKNAIKKLGDLDISHERIVTALLNAKETDSHTDVRGPPPPHSLPLYTRLCSMSRHLHRPLIPCRRN